MSPKRRWAVVCGIVVAEVLIVAAVGASAISSVQGSRIGFVPAFLTMIAVGVAGAALTVAVLAVPFYLGVAIHEAGHLLAGRCVGFRFRFVIVGPLKIERRRDRLHVGLTRRFLSMGLASTQPTDARDLRRRVAWMIAGGPLASLGLALSTVPAAYGLLAFADGHAARLAGLALALTGVLDLLLLLLALWPHRVQGFLTDGAQLLLLARGGPAADRHVATYALVGAMDAGKVRPRDLDPGLVARAVTLDDGTPQDVTACLLAFAHEVDRQRPDAAGPYLDRALASAEVYPPAFRPGLFLSAAYFHAAHHRDPAAARAFLERGRPSTPLTQPEAWLLAESAVLLAEGDPAAALARADAALALIEPDTADADALVAIRREALALLAGSDLVTAAPAG